MSLLSYNATELPEEEKDQILNAIGESEESKKICLEKLKGLLKGKKFKPSLDEEFLLAYLRSMDFNCDKVAYNIEIFYGLQRDNPDYFETCVLGALTKSSINPLRISPFRLKDHSLLLIHEYFQIDLSQLPLNEKMYLDTLSEFYCLRNPITQVCGVTIVLDAAGISVSKIPYYTDYKWITLGVSLVQHGPLRIKKIHFINVSEALICAYNLSLPFLPKKIVDLLQFHSDSIEFKDLHEFLPPETLPEKYGGHLKECDLINCMENILIKEDYFRKHFPLGRKK